MKNRDRWIGFVVMGIGLIIYVQALNLKYPLLADDPGPAFMPKIISILLMLCGLGLVIWPQPESNNEEEKNVGQKKNNKKMVVTAISIIVYVSILKTLGFILSTFLFLLFTLYYQSDSKGKKVAFSSMITSIIVTATIYFVFYELLNIILPRGII